MSKKADAEYYARRAVEHRRLSETTAHSRISEIHAELAARYAERALNSDTQSQKQSASG